MGEKSVHVALLTLWLSVNAVLGFSLRDALADLAAEKGCQQRPGDIVFILDESGSIWGPHFDLQLTFVTQVTDIFDTSPDMTHIGVMTYGTRPIQHIQLGQFAGHDDEMKEAIMRIRQQRGGTRTDLALEKARQSMFAPVKIRSWVPQIAIVITDGESDYPDKTAEEALLLREQGIHIMAIGVGHKILERELYAIASSPEDVFMVDNYEALDRLKDSLAWKACQVTTLPPPTTVPPTTTPPTTTPTTPSTTQKPVIKGCSGHRPLDLVFSLPDDMAPEDNDQAMDFMDDLLDDMELGPAEVQVGITPHYCNIKKGIHLSEHNDKNSFGEAVRSRGNRTIPTHAQLEYLNNIAFTSEAGGRSDAVPCAMIVIDSPSDDIEATLTQVRQAHQEGVEMMVIGVGNDIDPYELELIAGDTGRFWHVPAYNALPALKDDIMESLCQVMEKSENALPVFNPIVEEYSEYTT